MEFIKTAKEDINRVMEIINEAKAFLKANNVNQWQSNLYPNEGSILNDIEHGESYVVKEGSDIVATFALSFRGEKTYEAIYDGKWLTDGNFGVIHRIAICNKQKGSGISNKIIDKVREICAQNSIKSIKIDTHKDNVIMQKMLLRNGFERCGIIYLVDKSERIGFEKIV